MPAIGKNRNSPLLLVAVALLGAYMIFLIGITHLAQIRLRESAMQQVHLGLDNRAAALAYFYSVRCDDLEALSKDRAVSAFFVSRALGMSMKYGLAGSLFEMRRQFEALVGQRLLGDEPVYRRLLLREPDGKILVDTRPGAPSSLPPELHDGGDGFRIDILDTADPQSYEVVVSEPVIFKGRRVGTLLAWVDQALARRQLLAGYDESPTAEMWVATADGPLSSGSPALPDLRFPPPQQGSHFTVRELDGLGTAVRVAVPGTPFFLIGILPRTGIGDYFTSPWFTLSLGVLAVALLISVGGAVRTRTQNLVLRATVEEAARHQEQLRGQNLQLAQRVRAEKMLADVSARFIDLKSGELADGIDWMLGVTGEFAQADRSYVFEFSPDGAIMDNTFEWCAAGIEPFIERLQGLSLADFSWSTDHLLRGEAVLVPRVADLPEDAAAERQEFERQSIRSILMVPMVSKGQTVGFVGFDAVRAERAWTRDDARVLRVVSEFLVSAREREGAERELAQSERKLRAVMEAAGEGILGLDLEGRCVLANRAAVTFLGYDDASELVGKQIHDMIHHSLADGTPYPAETCVACKPMREGGASNRDDEVFWRKDGTSFPVEYFSRAVYSDGKITGTVINFSDISHRIATQRRLAFLAAHDPLTGIPNRAMFMDRLNAGIARARRGGKRLALIFLDLDRFKPVNDTHGHLVGDMLLQQVARRIRDTLREVDTVARIGGDEFGILLEGIARDRDAIRIGSKIGRALDRPFEIAANRLSIGASFGIALYPDDGEAPDQLLSAADSAMYEAKRKREQERE